MAAKRKGRPQARAQRAPKEEQQIAETAVVQRQYFEGKDPASPLDVKNEPMSVRRFLVEPAKVSVGAGMTLNLGNYESARIEISLAVPCYREEADEAYRYAFAWVEKRLQTEVADIRANRPKLF